MSLTYETPHHLPASFKHIEVKDGQATGLKPGQKVALTDLRTEPQTTSQLARSRWEKVNFVGTLDSENAEAVYLRHSASTNNIKFITAVSKSALEQGICLLYAEQTE